MWQLHATDKFLEKYNSAKLAQANRKLEYIYEIKLANTFSKRKPQIKMFVLVNSGKLSSH